MEEVSSGQSSGDVLAAGTGLEIAVALATIVVAPFTKRRPHQSGQIDRQIRPICRRSVGRTVERQSDMCSGGRDSIHTPQAENFTTMRPVEQQALCNLCNGVSCRLAGKPSKEQSWRQETSARWISCVVDLMFHGKAIPELARSSPMFDLDERTFNRNVRSARKGAAGGPSGTTCDHLRPLLDSPRDLHVLFLIAEAFSRGQIPPSIVQLMMLGRMTALRKKDGGVRGIVAGEVIRRLVSRTVPQQLSPAVAAATAPFQYALATRAGCECVSHALQAISDLDESSTVTSIDGISAFDTISRRAMIQGLSVFLAGWQRHPLYVFLFGTFCVHLGRRRRSGPHNPSGRRR